MIRLLILILILNLIPSGIFAADASVTGEQNLLLFYSNDVIGETEPCG
jgi:hypothetical protein